MQLSKQWISKLAVAHRQPLAKGFSTAYNLQRSSPLFSVIPPEIRNVIFALALCSYYDKEKPYPSDSYYSRPGYRYAILIDTALLRTCKLVYLETHLLPVSSNEHVFWFGPERRPTGVSLHLWNLQGYFLQMNRETRANVDTVHFFTQLWWLEDHFAETCRRNRDAMMPKKLVITVRQSDWWFWEENKPLAMKRGWGDDLKCLTRLEEFVVELEAIERDKDQLRKIAERMKKWTFELHDRRKLSAAGTTIEENKWSGPTAYCNCQRFNKDADPPRWERGRGSATVDPGMVYHVLTIKWEAVKANTVAMFRSIGTSTVGVYQA